MALPEVRRLAAETERLLRADLDPALVLTDLAAAITSALVAIDQMAQQGND